MITTLALFALSSSIGILLVQVAWHITALRFPGWALSIALGAGIGAGLTSLIYIASLFLLDATPRGSIFISVEIGLLIGLLTCWIFLWKRSRNTTREIENHAMVNKFLVAAWVLGAAFAVVYFLQSSALQPIGDWDGWTLWNMHAKFLAFGGLGWKKIFTEPLHPDYPLLTPGFIARTWSILGSDQNYVPILTAALYTFGVPGVLMAVLKDLRGWNTALLGGLVIFCSTGFIRLGADQYADLPLSYYFLAAIALIMLHDIQFPEIDSIFTLIGLCAGFCIWTKNDGWLILIALVLAQLVCQIHTQRLSKSIKEWGFFLIGLAPLLLIDIYYRGIAPANDMAASPIKSIAQLTDINRYFTVWNSMNHAFVELGKWKSASIVFLLALFGLGVGFKLPDAERKTFAFIGLTIFFLLIEYYFVYILTPRDLLWHLETSLDRLLMQIFPTFLLLFFSLIDISERTKQR